jgi:hypothetical protein
MKKKRREKPKGAWGTREFIGRIRGGGARQITQAPGPPFGLTFEPIKRLNRGNGLNGSRDHCDPWQTEFPHHPERYLIAAQGIV